MRISNHFPGRENLIRVCAPERADHPRTSGESTSRRGAVTLEVVIGDFGLLTGTHVS
jgi:hypothetical protein